MYRIKKFECQICLWPFQVSTCMYIMLCTFYMTTFQLEVVFYEKLGNEYKRSFVEMKYRLCDLMGKDGLLGPTVQAAGYSCPMPRVRTRKSVW